MVEPLLVKLSLCIVGHHSELSICHIAKSIRNNLRQAASKVNAHAYLLLAQPSHDSLTSGGSGTAAAARLDGPRFLMLVTIKIPPTT
jgi:hypothetical protein